MGALTPITAATSVLSPIVPGLSTIAPVLSAATKLATIFDNPRDDARDDIRASQAQALKQLQQKQDEQARDLEERTALEREEIAAQAEVDEEKRLAALRRAVARKKVNFASSGISSSGGSADAVLLGLFEESDDEKQERERLDDIRNRVLDQELESQNRLNILQRSQLAEQQRLERATSGFF